jgi:hypothetical protein
MQSLEDLFRAETMQLLEAVMATATVAERATVAHSAGMTLAWLDGVRADAPATLAEQIAIRRALRGVESDRRWEEMAQLFAAAMARANAAIERGERPTRDDAQIRRVVLRAARDRDSEDRVVGRVRGASLR